MNPFLWALVGAGALLAVGCVAAAIGNPDALRAIGGFIFAALVAPVALIALALVKTEVGWVSISPDALGRFAYTKRRGGGKAWGLFYNNRGVILVHGLKDNEPVPPVKVRNARERAAVVDHG